MSAPRRVLLGGLVAVPAITALAAASAFDAAWAGYRPYADAAACTGLTDAATSAWCEAQGETTAALAEAPARSLVELEAKLAAGLYWFDQGGTESGMIGEEAALLRSCLTDLRAIIGRGTEA